MAVGEHRQVSVSICLHMVANHIRLHRSNKNDTVCQNTEQVSSHAMPTRFTKNQCKPHTQSKAQTNMSTENVSTGTINVRTCCTSKTIGNLLRTL